MSGGLASSPLASSSPAPWQCLDQPGAHAASHYFCLVLLLAFGIMHTYIYISLFGSPPPIDPCFLASTSYSGRIPSASHAGIFNLQTATPNVQEI